MLELETPFAANNYRGTPNLQATWAVPPATPTCVPIFSAPHSVKHSRRGKAKSADEFTGSLARALGMKLSVTSVAAPLRERHLDDFSRRQDLFADALRPFLRPDAVVFDLHGMKDTHQLDICLGSGLRLGASFARPLGNALTAAQPKLRVSINKPFAAKQPYTVTHVAQVAQARHAVQVEISRTYRKRLMAEANLFALFSQAFQDVINKIR
jgi:hypothetical protein